MVDDEYADTFGTALLFLRIVSRLFVGEVLEHFLHYTLLTSKKSQKHFSFFLPHEISPSLLSFTLLRLPHNSLATNIEQRHDIRPKPKLVNPLPNQRLKPRNSLPPAVTSQLHQTRNRRLVSHLQQHLLILRPALARDIRRRSLENMAQDLAHAGVDRRVAGDGSDRDGRVLARLQGAGVGFRGQEADVVGAVKGGGQVCELGLVAADEVDGAVAHVLEGVDCGARGAAAADDHAGLWVRGGDVGGAGVAEGEDHALPVGVVACEGWVGGGGGVWGGDDGVYCADGFGGRVDGVEQGHHVEFEGDGDAGAAEVGRAQDAGQLGDVAGLVAAVGVGEAC